MCPCLVNSNGSMNSVLFAVYKAFTEPIQVKTEKNEHHARPTSSAGVLASWFYTTVLSIKTKQ